MKKFLMIAATAGLALAFSANAADAEKAKALAQSKNCLACHAVDKKLVGPAYTEISKKYKGNKDAEAVLVKKVINGGGGCMGYDSDAAQSGQGRRGQDACGLDLVPVTTSPQLQQGRPAHAGLFVFWPLRSPCTT